MSKDTRRFMVTWFGSESRMKELGSYTLAQAFKVARLISNDSNNVSISITEV